MSSRFTNNIFKRWNFKW